MELEEILRGCRNENAKSQKALVDMYATRLMATIMRYVSDRNSAYDILQLTWINIFKNINTFKGEATHIFFWMRRIAANMSIYHLRSRKRYLDVDSPETLKKSSIEPDTYSHLQIQELYACIAALPDKYREVFNLFVFEEYSHKEISALLEIEESTSRTRLTYARALLRKKIPLLQLIKTG